MRPICCLPILFFLIAGCEQLGIEGPAQEAAAREAEGRAIGSACRHSGRALEDCYTLNPRAIKAAVFTGWRDMDAYMRENSLEIVSPIVPKPNSLAKKSPPAAEVAAPAKENEPSAKNEEAPQAGSADKSAPAAPAGGKTT